MIFPVSLRDVVDLLVCPHCGAPLALDSADRTASCNSGHAFDIARQGYLNLRGSSEPRNADTMVMLAARDRFLSAGWYAPVADAVLQFASDTSGRPIERIVDCGAGPGYYLAHLLDELPSSRGIAVDVSTAAAKRAARAHQHVGSVVADTWKTLPIADQALDLVLSVFSPRNAAEFHRVLAPNGHLIIVSPQPGHLAEVRGPLNLIDIDPDKQDRLAATLGRFFEVEEIADVTTLTEMPGTAVEDLITMGPNAFHLDPDQIAERVRTLKPPLTITVSVSVTRWKPRPAHLFPTLVPNSRSWA